MKPEISKRELRRLRHFLNGQSDRKSGIVCRSSNGAYLDGWYAPDIAPTMLNEEEWKHVQNTMLQKVSN